MTTLRFAGDVPLWLGLLLSLIAGTLSWRYYRRESFDLPRQLKWFLPLLRSLAFCLGIMLLTGPVLHHRTTIGELGRVRIYLDASRSMTMTDRQMSVGRKLMIAEHLGWISAARVDAKLLRVADDLNAARRAFAESLSDAMGLSAEDASVVSQRNERLRSALAKFLTELKALQPGLPSQVSEKLTTELLQPLETAIAAINSSSDQATGQLSLLSNAGDSVEATIRAAFDESVADIVNSDESVRSALAKFDETPRWRRAQLALTESSAEILGTLRESHDVEVLTLFGDAAVLQNADPARFDRTAVVPGISDFSGITDLSSGLVSTQKESTAVQEFESTAAGRKKTAIVLLTDGQHNSGPSPLQTARVLGGQGVSFYCVSTGASQNSADLAVTGLEHPDVVHQKDKVRGVMIIRDQMAPGTAFVAQISRGTEVLWSKQLQTENLTERRVDFEFGIDELVTKLGTQFASDVRQNAVPLEFEASIVPLPQEFETANNNRTMRLAAIVSTHRVLIVDGRSRWETRYLRNVFERDEQWSVNTIIAGPGTDDPVLKRGDLAGQFPPAREALFSYDLIIVGEVSADLFTPQDFLWLKEFVEIRGGGMVLIDGPRQSLERLAATELGSLMPIEWLPRKINSKPLSFELTDRGAGENALRLATEDSQNRRFWTELPAPHAVVLVRALPGAEVLVEVNVDGQRQPALVTRNFGAGRVLYLATDETWRWRYKVADTWHQRIWNQLSGFVMPRPFAVSDEFASLDTGSVRYDSGSSVDVRVRLLGPDSRPAIDATVDALVWKDGQVVSTVSLNADPHVPGIYRGQIAPLPEGDYEVSVRAAGYSDSALKARSRFVVLPPESGEMAQTAANERLLQQISGETGGTFLREEDIVRLPELLRPLSSGRVVESETLPAQSYWWFAAMILLLSAEWILRKRAGML